MEDQSTIRCMRCGVPAGAEIFCHHCGCPLATGRKQEERKRPASKKAQPVHRCGEARRLQSQLNRAANRHHDLESSKRTPNIKTRALAQLKRDAAKAADEVERSKAALHVHLAVHACQKSARDQG
jgi:uncharacterized Zn finger protein (UPF0148 family)